MTLPRRNLELKARDRDPSRFEDVLSGLRSSFGIEDADLVAGSYGDLSAQR